MNKVALAQQQKRTQDSSLKSDTDTSVFYLSWWKKSLEYLPVIISLRGTLPSSSMISAIWSTWRSRPADDCKMKGGWGVGETDKKTNHRFIRQCPSNRPTLGVWVGGLKEREVRLTAHMGQIVAEVEVHRAQTWPSDIVKSVMLPAFI